LKGRAAGPVDNPQYGQNLDSSAIFFPQKTQTFASLTANGVQIILVFS
jgi:hypothetical protein